MTSTRRNIRLIIDGSIRIPPAQQKNLGQVAWDLKQHVYLGHGIKVKDITINFPLDEQKRKVHFYNTCRGDNESVTTIEKDVTCKLCLGRMMRRPVK